MEKISRNQNNINFFFFLSSTNKASAEKSNHNKQYEKKTKITKRSELSAVNKYGYSQNIMKKKKKNQRIIAALSEF